VALTPVTTTELDQQQQIFIKNNNILNEGKNKTNKKLLP